MPLTCPQTGTSAATIGANASRAIYSLIETATQHGLNPFGYLHYILDRAPNIDTDEEWDQLLPLNLDPEEIEAAFPNPTK